MHGRATRPEFRSEVTLIASAQNGDEDAIAYLLTKFEPLQRVIRSLRRRIDPSTTRWDDLESAGRLAALEALRRFDPRRGARFTTYVYHRVRGAMLEALYERVDREAPDGDDAKRVRTVPIETETEAGDGKPTWEQELLASDPDYGVDIGYERLERREQAELVRNTVEEMPAAQQEVLREIVVHGRTHEDVASARGVSRPAVTQILRRGLDRAGRELAADRMDLAA